MKKIKLVVLLLILLQPYLSSAQCSMCRAVIESEESGSVAEGINNGIMYLMAIPYILVGFLIYFVYKQTKK